MIVFRYLSREVLTTMLAVTFVVMLIMLSGRFVRFLADAASGNIAADVIFLVMYYRLPNFVELILPLGFFIGIMLAYGRLYVESEMVVLASSGMSRNRLLAYTMVCAALVSVFMSYTSLYLSPAGEQEAQEILQDPKTKTSLSTLVPGNFQSFKGAGRVVYAEDLYDDRTKMKNVFVTDMKGFEPGSGVFPDQIVVVAKSGKIVTHGKTNQRFLELHKGFQYKGKPGFADYEIAEFGKYGIRLAEPSGNLARIEKLNAVPTLELIGSDRLEYQAALQWRLSLPIIIPIVGILALGMSRTDPRKGRYIKMFPALLLYLAYLLSLNAGRGALEAGEVPVAIGLWPIHAAFLILGLVLYYQDVWILRWKASRQEQAR